MHFMKTLVRVVSFFYWHNKAVDAINFDLFGCFLLQIFRASQHWLHVLCNRFHVHTESTHPHMQRCNVLSIFLIVFVLSLLFISLWVVLIIRPRKKNTYDFNHWQKYWIQQNIWKKKFLFCEKLENYWTTVVNS